MTSCFFSKYPLMYNLLGANFCEIDLDGKSFEEVIHEYKSLCSENELERLRIEFEELFQTKDTNHEYISDLSNIYSENDEEMYEWLHELYGYLFNDE